MGPLMLDLGGCYLTREESVLLQEPGVGGVILFSRNFSSPDQLASLTGAIRQLRPDLLIAVDQEGGRVQRFREGLTRLPPMAAFGQWYDQDAEAAVAGARECGWLLATELLQFEIDFSFTPVLDLHYHDATVIGDRAFHREPEVVTKLGCALVRGLADAGMASVGKHFPGHGFVVGDTHLEMPADRRSLAELQEADLRPFAALVTEGLIGLMPAHVVYPQIDACPAGFSRIWLQQVVRRDLNFSGVIFSDDLSMAAAGVAGSPAARAEAALAAGCDMILVCNDPPAARQVLDWLKSSPRPASETLQRLARQSTAEEARDRMGSPRYVTARSTIEKLISDGQAPLAL